MTARPWREQLGSRERAAAASARTGMAHSICEKWFLSRVALRRRRASRGQAAAPLHRPAPRSEPGCRDQAHCGEMSVEAQHVLVDGCANDRSEESSLARPPNPGPGMEGAPGNRRP
jgi:hypothetical protein